MYRLKLLSKILNKIHLNPYIPRQLCLTSVRCMSEWVPQEVETHTGQKWDKNDYRLSRFVGKPKHVNPNWAIKLIEEVPPKACKDRVVWCDGGSGPEGHPKVYINLDKPGNHACGYCGLRFYKDDSHH